ncbi:MAG: nitroreductase family deazaflavin-dependent oxidoreductase [Salinibacterium sp.]|nr:nitroreductase family deazaflavin-dependent oxidoreductase [Salinibacterium sp.]
MFRARLGWIFRGRLLLLEHRGRTTGLARWVVLERAEQEGDTVYVASGFGTTAAWYKNLAANGVAFVSIGARVRVPAQVELLSKTDSDARLARYADRYPKAWTQLEGAMRAASPTGVADIRLVGLTLAPSRG